MYGEIVKRKSYVGYVYVDWTTDRFAVPFYVGKGLTARVKDHKRNKKHTNVAKKHGCRREIVFMSSCSNAVTQHEIDLISELHTYVGDDLTGELSCNFTKGGEGVTGRIVSEETRDKMRRPKKQSTKIKMSAYARNRTIEHNARISDALRGQAKPQNVRAKISVKLTGRHLSAEHINNIKVALEDPLIKQRMGAANRRENLSPARIARLTEISAKPVLMLTLSEEVIREFTSVSHAAGEMNVTGSAISHALNGWTKTCRGYLWRFK